MRHYLLGLLTGIVLAGIIAWGLSVEARLMTTEVRMQIIGSFLSQMR